ncbi:MAG: ABC transporter permease [Candidatus Bathyarchaeota archaeon]|nr:ABC transporter permease [Candidatus Bathyarchaeota archaeon]
MAQRTFLSLVRWELEEYLSLPVLAFLVASAIVAVLAQSNTVSPMPGRAYINLYNGSDTVMLIMTIGAGAFFARTYAGSISRGETKIMLSYPIKRWQLFFSKFTAMFLIIFVIYGATYSMHFYLDGIALSEPMFFVTLLSFLLQLMLACSFSIAVSMVTKSEIMSILAAVLLLMGIDSVVGTQGYFSAQGRLYYLFQYYGELTHGSPPLGDQFIVTANDVTVAVLFPAVVTVLLLIGSYVYFTRYLEVD